ncbi:uncharacterized protein B0I36DRAFT_123763 [Microdochium trichocladiopsis]|uniref:IBR domain-containing protein n=1 Tax=Microdochium trichocladiopsis TaxID=1682393 RepID=A0A9P8Y5E9_9PEZI|nr:uncharacterized protein B0I36DRAFT_123763 [Microdochium trichocladiopsis]KAH7031522.1 hypothetical protein B0I36DRAFT_123763 [Microdochium trichocladiopsis]
MTNPQTKLYCHNSACAAYIPPQNRGPRVGTCPKCSLKTCKTCLHKSHFGKCDSGRLAELSEASDTIMRLAEAKGWKRCPNCNNLVQKNGGCDELISTPLCFVVPDFREGLTKLFQVQLWPGLLLWLWPASLFEPRVRGGSSSKWQAGIDEVEQDSLSTSLDHRICSDEQHEFLTLACRISIKLAARLTGIADL